MFWRELLFQKGNVSCVWKMKIHRHRETSGIYFTCLPISKQSGGHKGFPLFHMNSTERSFHFYSILLGQSSAASPIKKTVVSFPEMFSSFRRHWLYANSCRINHCILQHNPWGGLYLWNLLLSLHFHIYLNHVIHSARRMCITASDFNPSLPMIWLRETAREQQIWRKVFR